MAIEVMPDAEQRLSPGVISPRSSRLQWHPVSADRFEVTLRGATVGFIEIVGSVYVSLTGPRYSRAVEVAQSLVWTDALITLDPERAHGGR